MLGTPFRRISTKNKGLGLQSAGTAEVITQGKPLPPSKHWKCRGVGVMKGYCRQNEMFPASELNEKLLTFDIIRAKEKERGSVLCMPVALDCAGAG